MVERPTYATAINCMDGRVQAPVTEWMQRTFGVDYVDMITAPGPIKLLVSRDPVSLDRFLKRVEISVNIHGSRTIALVAHADCAGNPAPKDQKLSQLHDGADVVRAWGLSVTIAGLWVAEPDWTVEQVFLIEPD